MLANRRRRQVARQAGGGPCDQTFKHVHPAPRTPHHAGRYDAPMFPSLLSRGQALGPPFRWLQWSVTLMLLSLMVGQIVLPWWIAQEGGAADLALYGTALSAISFIGMPLLSPLGDRHAKRRLIATGLAAFAIATAAIAGVASFSHYHLGTLIALQMVPLKVQSLGLSALWLGLCEAALSLGMLVGALGFSAWWARRQGRFAARVTAAVLQGCALGVAGLSEHPGVLVAAFAVAGLANSAVVLVGMTQRMLACWHGRWRFGRAWPPAPS